MPAQSASLAVGMGIVGQGIQKQVAERQPCQMVRHRELRGKDTAVHRLRLAHIGFPPHISGKVPDIVLQQPQHTAVPTLFGDPHPEREGGGVSLVALL